LVAERIVRFAKIVGKENVIACRAGWQPAYNPDAGFSQFW
jgi:hypothetical protein